MCEQKINLSKYLGKRNKIIEDFVDDAVYASSDEVLDIYDAEVIKQMEMQDMKRQGLSEGYDAGERNKQLEIAKNMLKDNIPIDIIMKYTNLTENEINNL